MSEFLKLGPGNLAPSSETHRQGRERRGGEDPGTLLLALLSPGTFDLHQDSRGNVEEGGRVGEPGAKHCAVM